MIAVSASTIAVIGMVVLVSAQAAQDAPKYTIKDVMKKAFNGKGSLVSKVTGGTATDAEKASFLDLVSALPGNTPSAGTKPVPTIALCAHFDTSPETTGKNVKPTVWRNYDGSDLTLPGDTSMVLRVVSTTTSQ